MTRVEDKYNNKEYKEEFEAWARFLYKVYQKKKTNGSLELMEVKDEH